MSLQDLMCVAECNVLSGTRLAPATEIVRPAGYTRHDVRIARILTLSQLIGRPISISYLDSCDVRALPVILERLELIWQHRAQRRSFKDWRSYVPAWWQRPDVHH
ncbi:MAG TPA: hypothetical protein VHB98_03425 [Chloroflexota bacterium]|jgi:hypothetical protein|nr:hypothetical protein [Chloroflexota bacterium]